MSFLSKFVVPLALASSVNSVANSGTAPDFSSLSLNLDRPSVSLTSPQEMFKADAKKERQAYVSKALELIKGGVPSIKGVKRDEVYDLLDATFASESDLVSKLMMVNGFSKIRGLLLGELKPDTPGVIDREVAKRYGVDTDEKVRNLNFNGIALDHYFLVVAIADLAGRDNAAKESGIVDLMNLAQTGLRIVIDGPLEKDFKTGVPLPKSLEAKWGTVEGEKIRDTLVVHFVELGRGLPAADFATRTIVDQTTPTIDRSVFWGDSKTERVFSGEVQKKIDEWIKANFDSFLKMVSGEETLDQIAQGQLKRYYRSYLETAVGYRISSICPHQSQIESGMLHAKLPDLDSFAANH